MPDSLSSEQPQTLEERLAALRAAAERLTSERDQYKQLYLEMLERCRKLELGIVGQKRERLSGNDEQLTLSLMQMLVGKGEPAAPAEPETEHIKAHDRKKPTGRKPIPEHLPRVDFTLLPPEVEQAGLAAFDQIGEDVKETVEYRRASLVAVRTHLPIFVPKKAGAETQPVAATAPADAEMQPPPSSEPAAITTPEPSAKGRGAEAERVPVVASSIKALLREVGALPPDRLLAGIYQAEAPDLPIPGGLAGPGLLARTIVQRWDDHLPLYRLERIWGREGIDLARSTICGWHAQLAVLVAPLVEAMWAEAIQAPYLCVDATGVLVQALEKCRNAHFFVVAAPDKHVLFGYSPKHNSEAVDKLLADYKGYLVVDAHTVYDHLFVDGDVKESGCWAHNRRYYFKALTSDPERARKALAFIKLLFAIEKEQATSTPEERLRVRKQKSKPIVDDFFAWVDSQAPLVLDETPISKAITYSRNQREALKRFLEDGRLPIHNNFSERQLRREAIGRKNWLFVGSDDGGEVNATFVSLLASCQLHKIEPHGYLRDLFCLLPSWPKKRVIELAPAYWKQTVATPEVQARLAANIFRQAALGQPDAAEVSPAQSQHPPTTGSTLAPAKPSGSS